jgi:hypothetical protein
MRNDQSWAPTSDCPTTTSVPASAPGVEATSRCSVTIERRLRIPTVMTPASNRRDVTKPSATASFCRRSTGKSTTPVPTIANATISSRTVPHNTPVVLPELVMKAGSLSTGE